MKTSTETRAETSTTSSGSEGDYQTLKDAMRQHFASIVGADTPLYVGSTADSTNLFNTFLSYLPPEDRQHYTCSACRRFFTAFGSLVYIADDGRVESAVFPILKGTIFDRGVDVMRSMLARASIRHMFTSPHAVLGEPVTDAWTHFYVTLPDDWQWLGARRAHTHEERAAKVHNFETVFRYLQGVSQRDLDEAVRILKDGQLAGTAKMLGPVTWLRDLRFQCRPGVFGPWVSSHIWKALATAPEGYCHPNAGIVGQFLGMVQEGADFSKMNARLEEMVDPTKYQRPQALPSQQNKEQAEKIFAKLGLEPALARRHARLDEIETIWRRQEATRVGTQVSTTFGAVPTKGTPLSSRKTALPEQTMTYVKFREKVLPSAERVQLEITGRSANYCAYVTCCNPDAPPILKWDSPTRRNPASSYVYSPGSVPSNWGLHIGWAEVLALSKSPEHWFGEYPASPDAVLFVLEGAEDSTRSSLALFPEILRAELHGVRATIEAYSDMHGMPPTPRGVQLASGYRFTNRPKLSADRGVSLRVFSAGAWNRVKIDRWD